MQEEQTFESAGAESPRWEPDMASVKKPLWPAVLGWICIALSSFGLVCGGLSMLMIPFGAMMTEDLLEGDPPPPSMDPSMATIGLGLIGLALALLLLVASIMLVTRRVKSRMLFLVYAGVGLPLNFLAFMNQLAIQAAVEQWVQDYPNNQMSQSMGNPGSQIGQSIALGLFILLGLGWPLFLLLWFGLLKTKPHHITGILEDDEYLDG
jgi:hypothetical protein